jgi:hypothetical protein
MSVICTEYFMTSIPRTKTKGESIKRIVFDFFCLSTRLKPRSRHSTDFSLGHRPRAESSGGCGRDCPPKGGSASGGNLTYLIIISSAPLTSDGEL